MVWAHLPCRLQHRKEQVPLAVLIFRLLLSRLQTEEKVIPGTNHLSLPQDTHSRKQDYTFRGMADVLRTLTVIVQSNFMEVFPCSKQNSKNSLLMN